MFAGLLAGAAPQLAGQSCTTQAKMTDGLRSGMHDAAQRLADAVQAGDAAKVQAGTVAEYASDTAFAATSALVKDLAGKLGGDTLQVTQLYALDARNRKAGDTSDADFSCVLLGTTAETDFSIAGLPPGLYGFVLVEATGPRPWLLAFLLRQDGGVWKMAGFYPRARTAAGHDGQWYWNQAYKASKANQPWLAWVLFDEADQLLRPANFASSTKLDSLRSERRNAAPPELADGLSAETPLVVKASDGASYSFTGIGAEGSEDGKHLDLGLHLRAEPGQNAVAASARNRAAAKALLDAHKDLRQDFDRVLVFAEQAGQEPVVTEDSMQAIP
jgi:hypothetical protein